MSPDAATPGPGTARPPVREKSPGLWMLGWQRLLRDRVGFVSLLIVVAFIVLMVLSGTGMVASGWNREVGLNYAPPHFMGADPDARAGGAAAPQAVGADSGPELPLTIEDPIGAELDALRRQLGRPVPATGAAPRAAVDNELGIPDPLGPVLAELRGGAAPAAASDSTMQDPLADVLAEIRGGGTVVTAPGSAAAKGAAAASRIPVPAAERKATLPFGADKWGRDVIQKVIKGSETSIFVGLAAALVATVLGTVFGAVAGYYGRAVDDFFNWFYSVFTSIPYLLLILAIAAVLPGKKGMWTIIFILGLTGWTGIFRLVRAEYLKHKSREYVQAADAIGASGPRKMFIHIFPNISHVVLVQLSLHVVGFIKAEVILSFLGFGVPVDVVSWGSMLNEAQNELILGKWWQLAAAGFAMALLVTAFSMFTDALRDALDPKLK